MTEIKTIKVLEKLLSKEAKVIVEDVAEAMDVVEILKDLKYNIIFTKDMDTSPLNVIIILSIIIIRKILLRKKRRTKTLFC